MLTKPEELFIELEKLSISFENFNHPAVFSAKDSCNLYSEVTGTHCKNLFLVTDKQKEVFLVSMVAHKQADLKRLAKQLNIKKLSFAKTELLEETLGIKAGSVTPFAVINDTKKVVKIIIDAEIMTKDLVNFHPLINTASTALKPQDLIRFIETHHSKPMIIEI